MSPPMERLDGGAAIPALYHGGIVALGNFDGVHAGHQAVIGRAVACARAEGRPALVATFDPHPVRFFHPDAPPFRLTTLDQRARTFAALGADAMIVLGFDAALAATSAEDFVADRLVGLIGASGVVTGEDFTFGRRKSGDATRLRALGEPLGLDAETVPPVADANGPISSTRIRNALAAGDPETAARLMTRPFAVEAVVEHGDKRGRTIGYPTANMRLGPYVRPRYGIYAVRGRLPDGRTFDGAANLGIRPSFDPPVELLEPHFFDFSGDLYGQTIEVALHHFLRPEARFDSLDALKAQMALDMAEAKQLLTSAPRSQPRSG